MMHGQKNIEPPKLVVFHSSVPRILLQALTCLRTSALRSYRDMKKNLSLDPTIIQVY